MDERILGTRLVELPGGDHMPWFGDIEALLDLAEEFLTCVRPEPESDRVLATVLNTDIVGATERVAELGDQKQSRILARHHELIRKELSRFRGREIDTAGDGFFAVFDGSALDISCAKAIWDGDHLNVHSLRFEAAYFDG
jgi:class 3 adenylate cyclase